MSCEFIAGNASEYGNNPKYQLPEPKPMMAAKTYHHKHAAPVVEKLKSVIRSILLQYYEKIELENERLRDV